MDYNKIKLLATESNAFKRHIREAMHCIAPELNRYFLLGMAYVNTVFYIEMALYNIISLKKPVGISATFQIKFQ